MIQGLAFVICCLVPEICTCTVQMYSMEDIVKGTFQISRDKHCACTAFIHQLSTPSKAGDAMIPFRGDNTYITPVEVEVTVRYIPFCSRS